MPRKSKFTPEYLDYVKFVRETQWDMNFIRTYLKKSEDDVQNYYDEYDQDEFNVKLKTDENFKKKWGNFLTE